MCAEKQLVETSPEELPSSTTPEPHDPKPEIAQSLGLAESLPSMAATPNNQRGSLSAYVKEQLHSHKVPLIVIGAILLCPKLLLVWIAIVLIWSGVEALYPRLPTAMRIPLRKLVPQKWKDSATFSELSDGVAQVRPFILASLYIFCIPLALVWMYIHWIMGLCAKKKHAVPKSSDDCVILQQNPRNIEEEREENFFHSPAFSMTALLLFVCGLPAILTYLLYQNLGIDAILGFPSLNANFKTVFLIIHLYFFSVGSCVSVLFLRSWFTFPLNFIGNEARVELTKSGIRRHVQSWFSRVLTWNAPHAGADKLAWQDIKRLEYDGTHALSLYPIPRESVPFNTSVYNIINAMAGFVEGINKRLRAADKERVCFKTSGKDEIGSSLSIELSDMDADQRARFYYAVRNWAPHVEIDERCQEKMLGSAVLQAPRYTQLWFQLLTNDMMRQRIGMLSQGDKLQSGAILIKERLASGGQANVYLASTQEGDEVVLKEFILSNADSVGALVESAGEFEIESTLLSQLNHPRIVRMLNFFAEDRRLYIVMEKVPGLSLRKLVKSRDKALDEATVVQIALQVLEVLEYLHHEEPPIVHRDIAPDNIMLDEASGVKVIDFSLAAGKKCHRTTSTMGKHCYAPPEQLREQPCPQSDIYALGATMYFLLVGEDPKPITTADVQSKRPGVSDKLHEIIRRATAFDLTNRYTEAHWMRLELQALAQMEPQPPKCSDNETDLVTSSQSE